MTRCFTIPMNGIVLGQILSLLVTSTSSISTELARHGASIPFTQGAINYILLFVAFAGPVRLLRWRWEQPAWKYMLVSGIDVLSTGCVVKAFSLTSITSVTLLDSWTIPCVIILTALGFGQKYTVRQLASAALAVSGLAVLLLFDDRSDDGSFGRASTLMGDALVIAGATGYAVNSVLTEHILKTGDASELLGGIGCFGIIASAVLVPIAEYQAIAHVTWSWTLIVLLAAYGAALFLFSLGMPVLLQRSGSTVFNLSLLTSDVYALTVRGVFFDGFSRQALSVYIVSCAMVVCGLVLYFTSPEPPSQGQASNCSLAPSYAAVDLYDAYTSSECGPSGFHDPIPGDTMPMSEDDRNTRDSVGPIRISRGGCRTWGSGSDRRHSETGSSPGQAGMRCSPVLSCAEPGGRGQQHDGAEGEGVEMGSADGNMSDGHDSGDGYGPEGISASRAGINSCIEALPEQ
eukprot:jgi/Ulvmu1/12671/UM094_0027.1